MSHEAENHFDFSKQAKVFEVSHFLILLLQLHKHVHRFLLYLIKFWSWTTFLYCLTYISKYATVVRHQRWSITLASKKHFFQRTLQLLTSLGWDWCAKYDGVFSIISYFWFSLIYMLKLGNLHFFVIFPLELLI